MAKFVAMTQWDHATKAQEVITHTHYKYGKTLYVKNHFSNLNRATFSSLAD
jgi:hypothetical protein